MYDDEEKIVMAARRWYAAVKRNRDPELTSRLAVELAASVVEFQRGRDLQDLKPIPRHGPYARSTSAVPK